MSSIRLKKNIVEQKRKSLIRIGIVTAILLLLCLVSYLSVDRTAPKFDFTDAASVYSLDTADFDVSTFMEGVKASDNVDGDLTDRIAIKSLRYNADSSVSVTYCVRDNSGNLTTEERIYNLNSAVGALVSDGSEENHSEASSADEAEDQSQNTEISSEVQSEEVVTDASSEENPEMQDPNTEPVVDTEPVVNTEPVIDTEPITDTEPPAPSEELPAEPVPDGSAAPIVILNSSEAHIAVGSTFNYPSYIAEVWDDLDGETDLMYNIYIENYELIDMSVSGIYNLIYHVIDSNGNISEGQPFTLYVEWQ